MHPAVCHKTSHINCCNGFSCEMMDNPNGDYGICRASDDRKKDEKCMSNSKNSGSTFLSHETDQIF